MRIESNQDHQNSITNVAGGRVKYLIEDWQNDGGECSNLGHHFCNRWADTTTTKVNLSFSVCIPALFPPVQENPGLLSFGLKSLALNLGNTDSLYIIT